MQNTMQIAILPAFKNLEQRQKDLAECLERLDRSLAANHVSMSEEINPVHQRLLNADCSSEFLANVLSQYSLLPAMIVRLLTLGSRRVQPWLYVYAEIQRNIAEEAGSRTRGIPHYEILKTGLLKEARLDISDMKPIPATAKFLSSLETALANSSPSFALGNVYALENSAIPELYIVARLINAFCLLSGNSQPLIALPISRTNNVPISEYTLDSFFKMHLLDFEVGHKVGLAVAIHKQGLDSDLNLNEFQKGFEYTLDQMDYWWEGLATDW